MLALEGWEVAVIVAAAVWGVLVIFLAVVLLNTFRLLESVKTLVDGVRQEAVPLLGEVRTTVSSVNRELDRVDGIVESAGKVARSAQRVTSVVEQAVSNPLVKFIAFSAGASRALRRLRRKKG